MNLLTAFTEYLQSLDRSPATVRGYITDLTVFSRWLERELTTLTPADVREYRASLLNTGAAATTVNRKLAAIAAFGNWVAQTGLLSANPALNIKSVGLACHQRGKDQHKSDKGFARNSHPHRAEQGLGRSSSDKKEVTQAKPLWQDGVRQQVQEHPGLDEQPQAAHFGKRNSHKAATASTEKIAVMPLPINETSPPCQDEGGAAA